MTSPSVDAEPVDDRSRPGAGPASDPASAPSAPSGSSAPAPPGPPVGELVASDLRRRRAPGFLVAAVDELDALDRAAYAAVAATPSPTLDGALRRLSDAANHSRLWLGIAAALVVTHPRTGKRAAAQGVAAIGLSSVAATVVTKRLVGRPRPTRSEEHERRHVAMPTSRSFPSGHSASAFAFANAVADELPLLGPPLRALAATVAYSRVHTGVHYPGDVVVGAVLGAVAGDVVRAVGSAGRRRGRR